MFIQCSVCDYKYIVNSADLKPDGRMVECANCNHRWYQEPLQSEELLSSSVPHVPQEDQVSKVKNNLEENDVNVTEEIKNLPSTVVREKKVSEIYSQLQTGSQVGMNTLEQSLNKLYSEGLITEEEAISKASNKKAIKILKKAYLR